MYRSFGEAHLVQESSYTQDTGSIFSHIRSVGGCDREFSKGKDLEGKRNSIFKDNTNHSSENTLKNIEGYQEIAVRSCKMRRHTHTNTPILVRGTNVRLDLPSASTIYPKIEAVVFPKLR
jgi:hypothetical protein